MNPFFSIITINLNNDKGLESTINSVINQSFTNYEYIIIDGKSIDSSLEIANKYKSYIKICISENDSGIYDAMNKGISNSIGKYLIFLNSGDLFYDIDVLKNVYNYLSTNFCYILYGNHSVTNNKFIYNANAKNIKNIFKGSIASHQSMFFNRYIFNIKKYNLKYKYAADFDLFYYTFVNHNDKIKYLNLHLSNILKDGLSESNSIQTYFQFYQISLKYTKNKKLVHIYFLYKILERYLVDKLKKIFI